MKQPPEYSRRGFTLIELLVAIAIISILASILFPVFARTRENARKASCLSNMKQLGLSMAQYTQDYDGFYPIAWDQDTWTDSSWVLDIQPYVKSTEVLRCPSDSGINTWAGQPISYAINSVYRNGWPRPLLGIAPIRVPGCWIDGAGCANKNESAITQAASTIMMAEKHGDVMMQAKSAGEIPWAGWMDQGNASGTGMNSLIGGVPASWHSDIGDTAWEPDSTRTGRYPHGPEGGVVSKHMEMANFLFVDGHAKAMRPAATNPDPNTRPQNNMWDGSR